MWPSPPNTCEHLWNLGKKEVFVQRHLLKEANFAILILKVQDPQTSNPLNFSLFSFFP